MKNINLYFQVHQPFRLKKYRFFNMGKDHFYFDDFLNRSILQKVAADCYLPMNALFLKLIREHGGDNVRVSFSISGIAIEQFKLYAPEVIDSFRELAQTGAVEFLAETYAHSLASLTNREEFERQVRLHADTIEELFGQRPTTFRNTELIYSDGIGEMAYNLGYHTLLTEGAKHILGWKSPNFVYANAIKQELKLLLRNFRLSDDIAFRFSDQGWDGWPLTADKYIGWIAEQEGEIINLFMDYETFGEHQKGDTGIFDFMERFVAEVVRHPELQFRTPRQLAAKFQPVSVLHVPHPISWADEERDITAWLGNELQDEAFGKLYSLQEKVVRLDDPDMLRVWYALQSSDHFYYMCTKWFSDGDVHSYFNPYDSPYDAFMNYMNVFSDFKREVERRVVG
ncbi:MAG: glycoside hydrolase family 57 protein [Rikenella sp.]|nr:glycoside hydrolase family 57 protein [Rikenella sp.]